MRVGRKRRDCSSSSITASVNSPLTRAKTKIEHAIRAFRERVDGSPRHGYSRTFIETRTWFQVQEACATAINENAIVVIVGKPGVGKTRSLIE